MRAQGLTTTILTGAGFRYSHRVEGVVGRVLWGLHPRAESFELQGHYLTYKLLRSSGVPRSVVYPTE